MMAAQYVVTGAAVAARVAGSDRYYERGAVLPEGVDNIDHLVAVGLVAEAAGVVVSKPSTKKN